MRILLFALVLLCCASGAEAQIQQGSFKLSIDTDLLSYSSVVSEQNNPTRTSTDHIFTLGPGASIVESGLPGYVAFALGYAVAPHAIAQLHLSFGHSAGTSRVEIGANSQELDLPTRNNLMLRPELEIPINPRDSIVGYGLLGFDYRHSGVTQKNAGLLGGDYKDMLNGYGPVLGAGLHIFTRSVASVDLGAQFSYLVLKPKSEVNGQSQRVSKDLSASIFSLTVGVSLWP